MKTSMVSWVFAGLLFLAGVVGVADSAGAAEQLSLTQTIPLPGVEGRIDHFALDAAGARLFVCALGNNTLEVLDLKTGERIRSIPCPGAPQGVAYAPGANRLLVANDKGGICQYLDAESYRIVGEIDLEDDADNVRYDPSTQCFYVGFGSGGIGIVNAQTGKLVGKITIPAHPEAFEVAGKRLFVNVPTAREVVVLDREQLKTVATWKTDGAFGNFPIAFDPDNHRLFIGCRIPSRLVVLDTDTGAVVAKVALGGDTDDVFYDKKRHRIYAVCGAGEIDILDQADANRYTLSGSIRTAEGARTGLFEPEQNCLYVGIPHRGRQPGEIRRYELK